MCLGNLIRSIFVFITFLPEESIKMFRFQFTELILDSVHAGK